MTMFDIRLGWESIVVIYCSLADMVLVTDITMELLVDSLVAQVGRFGLGLNAGGFRNVVVH